MTNDLVVKSCGFSDVKPNEQGLYQCQTCGKIMEGWWIDVCEEDKLLTKQEAEKARKALAGEL